MSRPPQTPFPWMRPPPREDDDGPRWCEGCQRMTPPGGCVACGEDE